MAGGMDPSVQEIGRMSRQELLKNGEMGRQMGTRANNNRRNSGFHQGK